MVGALSTSTGVTPTREPKPGRHGLLDSYAREIKREDCLLTLSEFAPVSQRLISLLCVPDRVFVIERGASLPSFTSSGDLSIAPLAKSMLFKLEAPADGELPSFGIHLSQKGDAVFCTVYDRKRGVRIQEELGSVSKGGLSWTAVESALSSIVGQ